MKIKAEFVYVLKSALKHGNPALKCDMGLFGQQPPELASKETFQPHKSPTPTQNSPTCPARNRSMATRLTAQTSISSVLMASPCPWFSAPCAPSSR